MLNVNSLAKIAILVFLSLSLQAQEFRVQLAAYVEKVPFTRFAFSGINNVYMNQDQNGIHRYYIRTSFRNAESAEAARKELVKRGFPHAQIIDIERERTLCGVNCADLNQGSIYTNISTENLYFRSVFFGFNKSSLTYQERKKLDELYEILKNNRSLKAKIYGHADAKGSPEYNIKISKRRARIARHYLVSKGIHCNRLKVEVFGESTPVAINRDIAGNDSPEGRKYNRRVVIAVVDKNNEVISDLVRDSEVPGYLKVNKQILRQQLNYAQIRK